ncbi:MAG: hypothetical protein FWF43_06775 [Propionibacteriaceae bacterium]|nr:hypothetical protein [Propionibacteriaceae bacterium]
MEAMPPWITVLPAFVDEKPLLFNLLQKHLYELSQFTDARVGTDGLFSYRVFDAYWSDEQRWPYLIHVGGEVAGFALIHQYPEIPGGRRTDFTLAEFFVMYPWRRQGVGRTAARVLTTHHPGTWQLAFSAGNTEALGFWSGIMAKTDTEIERVQVPPVGRSQVGRIVLYFTPSALSAQPPAVDLVDLDTTLADEDGVAETPPVDPAPIPPGAPPEEPPAPPAVSQPAPDENNTPVATPATSSDAPATSPDTSSDVPAKSPDTPATATGTPATSPGTPAAPAKSPNTPAKSSDSPVLAVPSFSPEKIEELVQTTRTVKFRVIRNNGYALEDVDAFMDQVEKLLTTRSRERDYPLLARLLRESRFHMSHNRGYQVTDVDSFVDQMVLDFTVTGD